MKNLTKLGGALSILALSAAIPAQALPIEIDTDEHGSCVLSGTTTYYYLYECENGAVLYLPRSSQENGGGGSGSGVGNPILD